MKNSHKFTIAAMLALATGCAAQLKEAEIAAYIAREPDRNPSVLRALEKRRIIKGMTYEEVALVYGLPKRINRSSYGPSQAVYTQMCSGRDMFQDNIYVYFDMGVVSGWQINDCHVYY